ncbi:MAG: protein kinase domain-containing protein [Desulfobulbia bacterium]
MNEPQQSASPEDPWSAISGPDLEDGAVPAFFFAELNGTRHRINKSDLDLLDASGGTSIVYLVKNGACKGKVLKLYKSEKLTNRRTALERKARKMLLSPPSNAEISNASNKTPQFAWTEGLLFDEDDLFIGLILPYVDKKNAYVLDEYIREIDSLEKKHQSITERVQVARNLSAAIDQLHKAGHYFVDMKAKNIFVFKETSYVCFIDCDGFSINRGEFPAREFTPGYIAPEAQGYRPEQLSESPAQDYYALALLIFQLFDFNNTPYQCGIEDKSLHSDDEACDMDTFAKKGFYAYGLTPAKGLLPNENSVYRYWPRQIRELFDQAFSGKTGGKRPSSGAWFNVLHKMVKDWDFEQCAKYPENNSHDHFKGSGCFVCEVFDKIPTQPAPKPEKAGAKPKKSSGRASSYEEPKPPSHWTDLIPPKYDRLREIHRKLDEGTRLPTSANILASILQFFWLLSHGVIGPGLVSGLVFLAVGLFAVWNPYLWPLSLIGLGLNGAALFLFADFLLYRRIDQQVASVGGFQKIDTTKIEKWFRPNHQGWIFGIAIITIFIGAVFFRMNQIQRVQHNIINAINSIETLKEDIEIFARERNFQTPISSYRNSNRDYQPGINPYAVIDLDGDTIVLTLKDDSLAKGKRVYIRPVIVGDRLDWSRCWSDDNEIPKYMMPTSCENFN